MAIPRCPGARAQRGWIASCTLYMDMSETMLEPGRNCWRVERAGRLAFLIDGAAYFEALEAAMERAQRSILIIAWDVNSRMRMRPRMAPTERTDTPDHAENSDGIGAMEDMEFGPTLDRLAAERPQLSIHILLWDYAPIYLFERQLLPRFWLDWHRHARVHARLASDHPPGASHHQKIVVIDDAVAFVGGLDPTIARWDTREHRPHDDNRRLPRGDHYQPFHDVQVAVDGDAARALAELARERWLRATGDELPAVTVASDPWPPTLSSDIEDVDVAIARTQPALEGVPGVGEVSEVREVEALYLDAIAAAKQSIYFENQYLTSRTICRALAGRLAEDDGPDILIVTPRQQSGRLERLTMGALRARRIEELRKADRHGRLRVMSPVIDGVEILVHGKVMVVDDRLARIGSSNLSERSMSLDTECDLAIESRGDERVSAAIRGLRNGLMAEHLGVTTDAVEQALARHGRLIPAVESLAGGNRTLTIFETPDNEKLDELILEDSLLDPAEPLDMAVLAQAMPREASQYGIRRLPWALAFVLLVLALAAVWVFTPFEDWVTPQNLAATAMPLGHHALGPVLAALAVAVGTTFLIPITVLVVAANLIFGPLVGPVTTMAGCLLSAALSYGLGRVVWSDAIKRMTGPRLGRLTRKLPQRGVLTMVAIRIVPIAPFTVINLMAGSAAFRFRDFLIGTVIGLLPGICGLTFATDRVAAAVRDPDPLSIALAVAAVALIAAAMWGLRTWLVRRARGNPRRSSPVPSQVRQAICNLGTRRARRATVQPATVRPATTRPIDELAQ
jgi:phospholipase D1/2